MPVVGDGHLARPIGSREPEVDQRRVGVVGVLDEFGNGGYAITNELLAKLADMACIDAEVDLPAARWCHSGAAYVDGPSPHTVGRVPPQRPSDR